MISLTPRLKAVAAQVKNCNTIVDVGTDHAYIPIYLLKKGIIARAIATDIHEGPYKIAIEKAKAYLLADKISVRLGDGLTPVKPCEAETAVIAGMGGLTIRHILDQSPRVVDKLEHLIIQPMMAQEEVRHWLAEHGWRLDNELVVQEQDRFYQIISAVPGKQKWPDLSDSLAWHFGPTLIDKGDETLVYYIKKMLSVNKHLSNQLQGIATPKSLQRAEELTMEIQALEELMQRCLLNANR